MLYAINNVDRAIKKQVIDEEQGFGGKFKGKGLGGSTLLRHLVSA